MVSCPLDIFYIILYKGFMGTLLAELVKDVVVLVFVFIILRAIILPILKK